MCSIHVLAKQRVRGGIGTVGSIQVRLGWGVELIPRALLIQFSPGCSALSNSTRLDSTPLRALLLLTTQHNARLVLFLFVCVSVSVCVVAYVVCCLCVGLAIYRFYIKCLGCKQEITFKTDPKNSDYIAESGATRNFEPWRIV